MQHAHIDETTPIQVLDSSEQLTHNREDKQSQEQDFSQEIKQMLEKMDTDMLKPELDKDIDLMPQDQ